MKNLYILLLAILCAPPTVLAHAHLVRSSPTVGAILSAGPTSLVLTFAERAQITAVHIQRDGDPKTVIRPLPNQAATSVTLPLPKLGPGAYTITWRLVGADHHVMSAWVRMIQCPYNGSGSRSLSNSPSSP